MAEVRPGKTTVRQELYRLKHKLEMGGDWDKVERHRLIETLIKIIDVLEE